MSGIGPRCHELRVVDQRRAWRIIYRADVDAVIVAAVFPKTTEQTPQRVIVESQRRLREYDRLVTEES